MDFKNTVLVMTSNLGSDLIQTMSGGEYSDMKDAVMEVVSRSFRPEFINRIDDAVVFHPLEKDQILGIARIQLETLMKRVQEAQINLEFNDDALELLVDAGYDPVYGARPLKRAIQRLVENPLAEAMLAGEFVGGDTIVACRDGDQLKFAKS